MSYSDNSVRSLVDDTDGATWVICDNKVALVGEVVVCNPVICQRLLQNPNNPVLSRRIGTVHAVISIINGGHPHLKKFWVSKPVIDDPRVMIKLFVRGARELERRERKKKQG